MTNVFIEQTGTATPFNGIDIGSASAPTFADLDGDGDLDAIVGEFYGTIKYFLNVAPIAITQSGGNTQSPQVSEGGTTDTFTFVLPFQPTANVEIIFNGGTQVSTVPTLTFTPTNWNIAQTVTVTAINDTVGEGTHLGVIRATSSSSDTRFDEILIDPIQITITDNDLPTTPQVYIERTGTATAFNGIDIGSFSTPTLADIDGDGDLDAIIGESYGNINYYQNSGTRTAPIYVEKTGIDNPFNVISVSSYSSPTLADLDADGDLDAIIGEYYGSIKYYQNTGNRTAPLYTLQTGTDNPFNGIDLSYHSTPTFADLDNDGDLDAIIGEYYGSIKYYQNTGSRTVPLYIERTGTDNPFNGIYIGIAIKPTLADIDGDGDLDATIGESNGSIKYYQNTGTDTATVTVTIAGVNDAPIAVDNTANTDEDSSVTIAGTTLLANDTDVDTSDTLTITTVTATGLGSVSLNGQEVTYNPNGQFESLAVGETTTDTFTYTIADGNGGTDTATVTVTIAGVNDAPVITSDSTFSLEENTTTIGTVNATDIDTAAPLTYSISGDDADLLAIDPNTGALSFATAPDFEIPSDANGDNVYEVQVS